MDDIFIWFNKPGPITAIIQTAGFRNSCADGNDQAPEQEPERWSD
jgi:hypothetical protein